MFVRQRLHSDQTVQFLQCAHLYRVRVESVECVAVTSFSGSTFFPKSFIGKYSFNFPDEFSEWR